jgi:hypothetical protein
MGTKPGERMMGQLERRLETISEEFNSQDVANTLWSMSIFCMLSSDLDLGFLSSLVSVASRLDYHFFCHVDSQYLCQVHQFFIACDIEESLAMRLPASIYALKADLGPACKAAFLAAPAHPSASQQHVSDTLRSMGLSVEDEFRCPKSGYSIDMRVQDKCPQGTSTSADFGVGWAVEFDGPSHFLACKAPTGATLIKRRYLELLGYILVSVPYWEWDELSGMDERRKYLEDRLKKQPLSAGADAVAEASQRGSAMQQPVNSSHEQVSSSEQGSQNTAVTADLERKGKMNPNAGEFLPEFLYLAPEDKLQCNVSVDSAAHSDSRPRTCTQAGGGVVGAE